MNEAKQISKKSLERLPKYLRFLYELRDDGVTNVSATTIAEHFGFNSIQVRKDIEQVSKSVGRAGIGFFLDSLILDLEEFLGTNNSNEIILVGAGKLGGALLNYNGFGKDFKIVKAFDNSEKRCDNKKIFHFSKIEEELKGHNIHIAIITVPKDQAQIVCDKLIECGIKVIWNFAPIHLKTPNDIIVKNEDLSSSLLILLKQYELEHKN